MRRRPPPEVDPDRLRRLLASARPRPEPVAGPFGWVPSESPPVPEEPRGLEAMAEASWVESAPAGVEPDGVEPDDELSLLPGGRHRPPPRVLTVPVALRGARVAVSVRAVVAFVVLLLVAVVFFAVRVARAQEAAAPQPVPSGEGVVARDSATFSGSASGGASGGSAGATTGTASARGSPESVVVDVVGQVARPGVVTVPGGSRVVDVLAAAGGALATADVQRLNLARLVADGEQLFVPKPGETPPPLIGAVGGVGSGGVTAGGAAAGSGGAGAGAAVGPIDLNSATLAALDTLPGVGPVLAQRILDWRAQHGRFSTVDELGEVSGIGDKLLEQIRPKVRV